MKFLSMVTLVTLCAIPILQLQAAQEPKSFFAGLKEGIESGFNGMCFGEKKEFKSVLEHLNSLEPREFREGELVARYTALGFGVFHAVVGAKNAISIATALTGFAASNTDPLVALVDQIQSVIPFAGTVGGLESIMTVSPLGVGILAVGLVGAAAARFWIGCKIVERLAFYVTPPSLPTRIHSD
jgi:hypothetical protein